MWLQPKLFWTRRSPKCLLAIWSHLSQALLLCHSHKAAQEVEPSSHVWYLHPCNYLCVVLAITCATKDCELWISFLLIACLSSVLSVSSLFSFEMTWRGCSKPGRIASIKPTAVSETDCQTVNYGILSSWWDRALPNLPHSHVKRTREHRKICELPGSHISHFEKS